MSDDVLETFPFDAAPATPAGEKSSKSRKSKKTRKDRSMPVEEIDALESAAEPVVVAEEVEAGVPSVEPPVYETSEEPVGHDFDALPSAPVYVERTPWEQFLAKLPRAVLTLIYESGLLTREQLLAHSEKTLLVPIGRFTQFHLGQLQSALHTCGWQLSENVPAAAAQIPDWDYETAVPAVALEEAQAFQQQRHAELLRDFNY